MKLKKAFSFIEVVVSILVISIALTGILTSKYLIKESRIANAKILTTNSPLAQLPEVTFWLETTSDTSFKTQEVQDYQKLSAAETTLGKGSITKWYDRNPHPVKRNNAVMTTSASAPKYYRDCLKGLPCLHFDKINQYYLDLQNTSSLILNDYSIFIVDKRNSFGAMSLISSDSHASGNESLEIGYTDSDTIYWNQGGTTEETYAIPANHQEQLKLHIFINASNSSGVGSLSYYINEDLIAADNLPVSSDFSALTLGSPLKIGGDINGYYDGSVGEIIIVPYAVSKRERIEIQQYLLKKWTIQ